MAVAALATFTVRLLFLGFPVMADEAGLLMVASQWQPGSSLYGDYWVDRPPGLIAIFVVADALGGTVALRVIGALAAATAVVAGAWLGARTAPRRGEAPFACALVVAALVSSPLLDVDEIGAEILALPLLLAGLALVVVAATGSGNPTWPVVAAGAAGTAAVFIKQNLIEVWLAVAVVAAALVVKGEVRRAALYLVWFMCGGLVVAAALLTLAWARGTSLADLWDANVIFRIDAGAVIAEEATEANLERARRLALAWVATGMPVLLILLTRLQWRRPPDNEGPGGPIDSALAWASVVLLGWEAFAVASGGSYWLHYLLLPVPGLTLLVAVSMRQHRPRRSGAAEDRTFPRWVFAPIVASTMVGLVVVLAEPSERPAEDRAVIDYLQENREQGRTAVVAFGNPAVLWAADMRSPYEHLWSLPVRVRDPELRGLIRVLRSPDRPQWVIRVGDSLATWGVDADRADRVLDRHYRPVYANDQYTVLARMRG
ncbi:hypothetical protein [Nocardioides antri]|uniref:Glycosyltransferase RgtA/B/C/D-like domain-containing protein n=1 Tax=Nocardioides antri TaxID=2607659 RepID=A0A5B1M6Z7_9ACTN|nr:hypothetical protein [Nocardioides antri]KAA1428772.1 hypothetical protein F0U47_00690 [Nocardioides antri]